MQRRNAFLVILGLFVLTLGSEARAQKLSGKDIFGKALYMTLYQGEDLRGDMTMVITEKSGKTRTKRFTACRRNDPKSTYDQKFYLYFRYPADDARMVFMAEKKAKGDERWMYLPSLDMVKRIAAQDKRTSFVGSDFVYEDVSGRDIELDNHELIETNKTFYVVESKPKKPGSAEFTSYKTWIHKKTFVPVTMEFYKKGQKSAYRVVKVDEVKDIDGFKTIVKTSAYNKLTGTQTVLSADKVHYNTGIKSSLFSQRYLRRKPSQCIK